MEDELGRARGRAGRGGARGVRRRAPGPRRHRRREPAHRLVPVPRPHRRRQDRAGQGARGVPVRRRAGDGPHRHERVRREALAWPGWSARRPATSATTRAASSPRRCGAARTRWCCSTRSRRPTRTCSTCCCRCSTTGGSPTARAARSTSATRSWCSPRTSARQALANPTLDDRGRRDAVMAVVQSALQAGVPQPARRRRGVPRAVHRGADADRRHPARRAAAAAGRAPARRWTSPTRPASGWR